MSGFITGSAKEIRSSITLPVPMRSATPSVSLPSMLIRGVSGYSVLTPDANTPITPTSATADAENEGRVASMRIRFSFDSAIDTNNTPVAVQLRSECALSADL